MEKKITKKDRFNQLLAISEVVAIDGMRAFLLHELELLEKKSTSKSTKQTATQKENEMLRTVILEILADANGGSMTISDLCSKSKKLNGLSSSKMSALLKPLVDNGVVNKSYDKKKAYFSSQYKRKKEEEVEEKEVAVEEIEE